MNKLTFDLDTFYLDGKPFRMIAGDIHYFRIHEGDWGRRLDLAVDFGLNTVQTYVPWNAHEPKPGEYCFEGMLDIGEYLKLCGEKGLKVLLRPSPYICSEWDLGGLPAWLLRDRSMSLRSSDPSYLEAVRRYYDHLIPEFLPYLATNGGPVIAVAIENEYGSYGNDHEYLSTLADMLREGGVDVPLYTTDGDGDKWLVFGRENEDNFFGVNYRAKPGTSAHAAMMSRKYAKASPFFVGEFWAGRAMHWGEPFHHRPPEETSLAFKEVLELGGHVCFYMFAGGTNFGFMGGANTGLSYSPRPGTPIRYIPHTTSYSEDTMLGEGGETTEKYFLCRDVLDEYLGREKRPHVYVKPNAQTLDVELCETAELFDNLEELTEYRTRSPLPRPMEDYGQSYGLILYTTKLDAIDTDAATLRPQTYRDRANIYVDGAWLASFLRDRGATRISSDVKIVEGMPTVKQLGVDRRIDVLVENLGRVNYGEALPHERKGMEEGLRYLGSTLFDYDTRTLPLSDLSRLKWTRNAPTAHKPCFYRGSFDADRELDTYVSFEDFGHGYIWVNGFNLGRYDGAGPQLTLYLPRHLLRETQNELIILDIDPTDAKHRLKLLDHEILEGDARELD